MAQVPIIVGAAVTLQPGDTALFWAPSATSQYHIEVVPPSGGLVIGIWKGTYSPGNGVARNKAGQSYVDHVCGAGAFVVTVLGQAGPVTLGITANSWWKKVFGW